MRRVQYASGHTRRLDSAVRMNTLDGARQLNMDVMYQVGKDFDADGVEISAHALCAEDHLDIQGEQMSYEEFDRLQGTLEREIGTWNCRHFATPIQLGISQPSHTPDELAQYKANSRAQIDIEGVTRSRYEWSQEMQKIETAVRYQKDIANAAKATGDDVLRRNPQSTMNDLIGAYGKITEGAGLSDQSKRMGVSTFRPVKTIEQLKNPPKSGIIITKEEQDKATRDLIRSSAVNKQINAVLQNRHIKDSGHYIEGRSYVYGGIDSMQSIVDELHGTGELYYTKAGNWNGREIVTVDHDIGVCIDLGAKTETVTNRATIHYGKNGTHVVPTHRKED